jgi:hypothetical protein
VFFLNAIKTICEAVDLSPVAARSTEDISVKEDTYKADFDLAAKFQAFSKELVRISLLGLAAFGFLIKIAVDRTELLSALRRQSVPAVIGVSAFALCAASALLHGYLGSKCLYYQLNILRHLQRLGSDRWNDHDKKISLDFVANQRRKQASALKLSAILLLIATFSLVAGAFSVAFCSVRMLLFGWVTAVGRAGLTSPPRRWPQNQNGPRPPEPF